MVHYSQRDGEGLGEAGVMLASRRGPGPPAHAICNNDRDKMSGRKSGETSTLIQICSATIMAESGFPVLFQ